MLALPKAIMGEFYSQGSFQQDYIQRCIEAGEPLNPIQISALESSVENFFGPGGKASRRKPIRDVERGVKFNEYPHVGELIKERRLEENLSLRKLADRAGLHYSNIWEIEANKIRATRETLDALAGPLHIGIDKLYVTAGYWPPSFPRSKENLDVLEQFFKGLEEW